MATADNLRRLLRDSPILESHRDCDRLQDSYSLRCVPQVHGATRDTVRHVENILAIEINAVTDNPILDPDGDQFLPGGNFHGAPIGLGLDFLAIAVTDLAAMSERRIERLLNPALSGLPPFLAGDPGLESGFMMAQVTAAALVSENKGLSHPASVDSIPTSAAQEDHVSMATWAARKAMQVLDNAERVIAIEILTACQGLDHLAPLAPAPAVAGAHAAVRKIVAGLDGDRVLSPDIEAVRRTMRGRRPAPRRRSGGRPARRRRRSEAMTPRTIRAPRGTERSCRDWPQEAALRMLMNNLDPEVAERPQDLVVYGGSGRAARDWPSYDGIVRTLRDLRGDETLLVQSGKPVAVFPTHPGAPRVLIVNSLLVPALGQLGHLPRSRTARPDDVRADDRRQLDLHRHPGDPAGHL